MDKTMATLLKRFLYVFDLFFTFQPEPFKYSHLANFDLYINLTKQILINVSYFKSYFALLLCQSAVREAVV